MAACIEDCNEIIYSYYWIWYWLYCKRMYIAISENGFSPLLYIGIETINSLDKLSKMDAYEDILGM